MKNSGIEWIGEIPDEWDVVRLKNVLKERNETNKPVKTTEILSLTNDRGVIPYGEKGDVGNKSKEDLTGYKLAYPNDIVLNSMNVIIGSVALSKYYGCVSPVYYMLNLRHSNHSIEYYNFLFQTKELQSKLKGYGNGIMEIRLRIPIDKLNSVDLPVPPAGIQHKIVQTLNERLNKVDKLIENEQKQIEKMKEYKQSVITSAVTKGRDKSAPMKDSGIDWIGEIPESWIVKKAKYCVNITNGTNPKLEGNIPVYGSGANSFSTCGEYKEAPAVLIGRKGATLHIPHYIEERYWNVDTAFDVKAILGFELKYYYYLATAFDYKFYISQSTLPGMTQTSYENMFLPIPSEKEQQQIVEYLDKKCGKIDRLIAIKQEKIEKLQEYKKSLIYEYVTGKKEVV